MPNETSLKEPLTIYHGGRERCVSGHSFGPAVRPHFLIHFILKGKGLYIAGGQEYLLKTGNSFLIRPGETTYYEADEQEPWEYAWAAFDGYEAGSILKRCGFEHSLIFSSLPDKAFATTVTDFVRCFQSPAQNQFELIGRLYLIFSHMLLEGEAEQQNDQSIYCSKVYEYIHNNFSYDIKISEIARHIGIDRTYLYKLFKREKGISPQRYLLRHRLNQSMNLLLGTTLNITEIAYSCGFKDAPSFCRHFKTATSKTPLQYRKMKLPHF